MEIQQRSACLPLIDALPLVTHCLMCANKNHVIAIAVMAWFLCGAVHADTTNFASQAFASGDTQGKTFAVIDKMAATVSLYNAKGKLIAVSPVLLGQAKGDHSVPGIGTRLMADIAPHERTTPAGRFASEPGKTLTGQTVVWIDYDAAVSMHKLRPSDPTERRPERMSTPTSDDNRITYGCVNVPVEFFERWILPTLGQNSGVIYVLPEMQPARKQFVFLR